MTEPFRGNYYINKAGEDEDFYYQTLIYESVSDVMIETANFVDTIQLETDDHIEVRIEEINDPNSPCI